MLLNNFEMYYKLSKNMYTTEVVGKLASKLLSLNSGLNYDCEKRQTCVWYGSEDVTFTQNIFLHDECIEIKTLLVQSIYDTRRQNYKKRFFHSKYVVE